ncbi:MAG: YdbL family protein [bacterium]|nr:YdbL family protein [bacterium]
MDRTRHATSTRIRGALAALLVASLVVAVPLAASAEFLLGTAKSAGQVGEKRDGFLELFDEKASEKIKKMVADTNERRRSRYESIAQMQGSSIEIVGRQAGARIIARAKPGELIETPDGEWEKKK